MHYSAITALGKENRKAGLLSPCSVSAGSLSPLLWHLLPSNPCIVRLENNHHNERRLLQLSLVWLWLLHTQPEFCSHTGFMLGTLQT